MGDGVPRVRGPKKDPSQFNYLGIPSVRGSQPPKKGGWGVGTPKRGGPLPDPDPELYSLLIIWEFPNVELKNEYPGGLKRTPRPPVLLYSLFSPSLRTWIPYCNTGKPIAPELRDLGSQPPTPDPRDLKTTSHSKSPTQDLITL